MMVRDVARGLRSAVRELPDWLAERVDRWVMDLHSGMDVSDAQDGSERICTNHWGKPRPWPCEDYLETYARRPVAVTRPVTPPHWSLSNRKHGTGPTHDPCPWGYGTPVEDWHYATCTCPNRIPPKVNR